VEKTWENLDSEAEKFFLGRLGVRWLLTGASKVMASDAAPEVDVGLAAENRGCVANDFHECWHIVGLACLLKDCGESLASLTPVLLVGGGLVLDEWGVSLGFVVGVFFLHVNGLDGTFNGLFALLGGALKSLAGAARHFHKERLGRLGVGGRQETVGLVLSAGGGGVI
jgi:hypothetical protein